MLESVALITQKIKFSFLIIRVSLKFSYKFEVGGKIDEI